MSDRSFYISVVILLLTLFAVVNLNAREAPVVVKTNLELLPMEIGGYTGVEDHFSLAVYQELNADKHVYRHYQKSRGERVSLYVGYYGTAKGGRTGHNPYACLPGAGWGVLQSSRVVISNKKSKAVDGDEPTVNYVLAKKDDLYEVVLHWYQSDKDKVLSTGIQQNVQRFFGRVFHNRNDGAFVRVSAVCAERDIEKTMALTKEFAMHTLDLLPYYWPEEG